MQELLNLFGGSIVPPLVLALAGWLTKEIVSLCQSLAAKVDAHASVANAAAIDAGIATLQGLAVVAVSAGGQAFSDKLQTAGKLGDAASYRAALTPVLDDLVAHAKAAAPQVAEQFGELVKSLLTNMIVHEVNKIPPPNPTAPAAPAKT